MHNPIHESISKILSLYKVPNTSKNLAQMVSSVVSKENKHYIILEASKDLAATFDEMAIKAQDDLRINGFDCYITITNPAHENEHSLVHKEESRKKPIAGVKRVILVASGKGGVGKSTMALNIALSLSNLGHSVALADVDIYGPSLPALSGIDKKPVLDNNMMIPHKKFKIKLMSVGYLVSGTDALVWRGPMTTKMLFQLLRQTDWAHDKKEVDYLVIDTPPGTGDVHLSLAENYKIDGAVVISTPQELAVADVRRSLAMFKKLEIPVIGLVENHSYFQVSSSKRMYLYGKSEENVKLAKSFGTELLMQIPISEELNESCNKAKPLCYYKPKSEISQRIMTIAEKIVDKLP